MEVNQSREPVRFGFVVDSASCDVVNAMLPAAFDWCIRAGVSVEVIDATRSWHVDATCREFGPILPVAGSSSSQAVTTYEPRVVEGPIWLLFVTDGVDVALRAEIVCSVGPISWSGSEPTARRLRCRPEEIAAVTGWCLSQRLSSQSPVPERVAPFSIDVRRRLSLLRTEPELAGRRWGGDVVAEGATAMFWDAWVAAAASLVRRAPDTDVMIEQLERGAVGLDQRSAAALLRRTRLTRHDDALLLFAERLHWDEMGPRFMK